MTIEESKKFMALIKVAYPTSYKDVDRDFAIATIKMWQTTFPTVPFPIMEMAFDHFRKKSKFPPTVADICAELKSLYHTAIEDVLTSNNKQIQSVGEYIMEHTRAFTEGFEYQGINYNAVLKLSEENKNTKMIEGDDNRRPQNVRKNNSR